MRHTALIIMGILSAGMGLKGFLMSSRFIDGGVTGISMLLSYHGIIIVSVKSEAIRLAILNDLNRGVTVYKGSTGLTEKDQDILYCVVTRLDISKIKGIAEEKDAAAFIVVHSIEYASGGTLKKRLLHQYDELLRQHFRQSS